MIQRLLILMFLFHPLLHAQEIQVVTSFSILEDISKNIGKDHIRVSSIIKSNQNAHGYEPTPADIKKLSQADIFIVNGLMFEGWLHRAIEASGFKGVLVTASDHIAPLTVKEEETHHGHAHHSDGYDPHIWQNPLNGIIIAENIKNALVAIDPAHQTSYEQNFSHYQNELLQLDEWIKTQLTQLKAESNNALIIHNSFQYFTARYPLNFIPVLTTDYTNEPSAKDIAVLKNIIRQYQIHVIFSETLEKNRFLDTLIQDYNLKHGGALLSDALTDQKGEGDTYISLFKHNVHLITTALKDSQ